MMTTTAVPRNDRGKRDRIVKMTAFYDDEPEYFLPPNGDVIPSNGLPGVQGGSDRGQSLPGLQILYAFAPGGYLTQRPGTIWRLCSPGLTPGGVTGVTDNASGP